MHAAACELPVTLIVKVLLRSADCLDGNPRLPLRGCLPLRASIGVGGNLQVPLTRDRLGAVAAAAALFCALPLASASASPIAYDGFDYPAGQLGGNGGGTGDWKDNWQGDTEIEVVTGGYSYTDSKGNTLAVVGNHIETSVDVGSAKKATRSLNNKLGEVDETVWLSALVDGTSASDIHNLSLGDGLFIGQGGKNTGSTTFLLSDQDGVVGDTGVSSATLTLLVLRVDFSSVGDELAWMWVDPDLDVEPTTASADASGTIKSFEADFLQMQFEIPSSAGIDEVQFGYVFSEAVTFTPTSSTPEPGTATTLGLGLVVLSLCSRRTHRRSSPKGIPPRSLLRRDPL